MELMEAVNWIKVLYRDSGIARARGNQVGDTTQKTTEERLQGGKRA